MCSKRVATQCAMAQIGARAFPRGFSEHTWGHRGTGRSQSWPGVAGTGQASPMRQVCLVADAGMISKKQMAAVEARGWLYILGARLRRTKEVRDVVLSDTGPFETVEVERQRPDPMTLQVKEVTVCDTPGKGAAKAPPKPCPVPRSWAEQYPHRSGVSRQSDDRRVAIRSVTVTRSTQTGRRRTLTPYGAIGCEARLSESHSRCPAAIRLAKRRATCRGPGLPACSNSPAGQAHGGNARHRRSHHRPQGVSAEAAPSPPIRSEQYPLLHAASRQCDSPASRGTCARSRAT